MSDAWFTQQVAPAISELPEVWRLPDALLAALKPLPRPGGALGFEVRLGPGEPTPLDLAAHLEADGIAALPAWLKTAPEAIAQHPAWRRLARLCRTLASEALTGIELALEYDAGAVDGGVPVPAVFVVLDEALEAGPAEQAAWYRRVLEEFLPCLRGEDALPAALKAQLERVIAGLPEGALAAHFGVMMARPVDVVRVCVSGVDPSQASPWLAALGQPGLAELLATGAGAPLALETLATFGRVRYFNLDIGARWLPRIGAECHLTNALVTGLDGPWQRLMEALVATDAATEADVRDLAAWCGVSDGDTAMWRSLTHLKLEYQANAGRRPAKVYLKAQPIALSNRIPQRRPPLPTRRPAFPPALLHAGCLRMAAAQPDHPALIQGGMVVSYGALVGAAWSLAAQLNSGGAGPGCLVGVLAAPGPEQAIAALAILLAGAAYLPLDASWPVDRIRKVLSLGDPVAVVVQAALADMVGDAWPTFCIDPFAVAGPGPWTQASPDDLAYVIFTSGTTGQPKGAMLRHRAAWNTLADINDTFAVGPADRVLAISSLAFDLSVYDLFGTWAAGATMVYPEAGAAPYPVRLVEAVRRHGVTFWNSVPATFKLVVDYLASSGEVPDWSRLRVALLSGDWIPVALPAAASRLFPELDVISLGGATEGAVWSIMHRIQPEDGNRASIPYGVPTAMRGQEVLVLDAAMKPCPPETPGELYLAGAGVADGYWRDADRTAERFVRHPESGEPLFRTGDWGQLELNGLIIFLGRQDAQVKVQGYRVDLTEVESTLATLPRVKDVAVTFVRPAHGEAYLAAHLVLADGHGSETIAGLLAQARTRLPAYMVPAPGACVVLDALPLTPNGKVDRQRLSAVRDVGTTPDDAAIGVRMLAIWQTAFGDATLDADDDFFACGGDSITAVQIAWRVHESLGIHLPLTALYEAPTAARLAAFCQGPVHSHDDEALAAGEALDPAVRLAPDLEPAVASPRELLLTGATGYLGIHLVRALLANPAHRITCLVRAETPESGLARLLATAARFEVALDADRLRVVTGEIAHPRLGLSNETWATLASGIEAIYHCAAQVSFVQPYRALRDANVGGTAEVLRLATTIRLKPVFAVSSLAALGMPGSQIRDYQEVEVPATPPSVEPGGLREGGYPLSKWAAERLLAEAGRRGVPVWVFRPGFIFGHSDTGACNRDGDLLVTVLQASLDLGCYPDLDWPLQAIGVDAAAAAIAAADPSSASGGIYHLSATGDVRWRALFEAASRNGHRLSPASYAVWRARLMEAAAHGNERCQLLAQVLGERLDQLTPPHIETTSGRRLLGSRAPLSADLLDRSVGALALRGALSASCSC